VKVGKVEIVGGDKPGIKATVEAGNYDEARQVLGANAGRRGRLLFYDSTDFMGERAEVEITPDQAELPVGADDDEAAERSILEILASLGPDEAASVLDKPRAESLLSKGFIKVVSAQKKGNHPARYAITLSGRQSLAGDDE
jgi:hypothetical protein